MAAVATFKLDFTQWDASLKAAQARMKDFEKVGDDAARTFAKLARSFSGQQIQKEAKATVAAIEAMGKGATDAERLISGAAKLTVSEQRKVNAMVQEAIDKYRALGKEAPHNLQLLAQATRQVTTETEKATTATSTVAGNFGKTIASYAAGLLTFQAAKSVITGTVGAIVDFGQESVKSFAAAEAAQKKMVVALRAQGQETPEVIDQYNELAATIQKTTAFSDDAASEMQALFITIGNVGPAQMEKATTAATDLAAGLGLDLTQAATLVAKALEGNIGALSRYGISLDKARVEAEGADYIFAQINERFGGQAQAQLETYSGQLQQLANDWDNVKEAVGRALVTNDLTIFAMRQVRDAMGELSGSAEDVKLSVGDMWQGLGGDPIIGTAIDFLSAYVSLLNEANRTAKAIGVKPLALPLPPTLPKIDNSDAIEAWDEERRAAKAAAAAIKAAAEAAAKAYKTWAASVTGLDKAMKAADLEKNLARLTAEGKLNATATQAIIKEYNELRPSLDRLSDPLEQLRTNYQAVLESTRAVGAAQAMINSRTLPDATRMYEEGQTAVQQYGVRLKYLESASLDLVVAMNAIPGVVRSTAVAAEFASRTLGQRIGSNLADNLQDALEDIPRIITDALIHGATVEQTAAAIGTVIGAAIGKSVGEALGGPLGGKIGEAFGALLGPLLDTIIVTRAEQTQRKIRNEYGVAISEGLAQAIEDASAQFGGDRQAAKLFNLDRIIAEGGGLSQSNIDLMLARLHDVFSAIETGAFTTDQAMQVLDKNFANFAAFVTRDGALASQALLDIIHLNEEFGTSSAAVAEFVTKQLTGAIGGLTTFLQNAKVTSQAAADGIAASVFGIFEALTKQGATPLEAIKQITPVLEQLDAQLKAAGFSGGAAFDQIRALAALASDQVKGPMIEAITGLGQALEGLHNSGVLNQEMFAGLATQVTDTYNKLIAQGTDASQALQLIGPTLQTLWELQEDFGYAVDDATQKLIDQGVAAGQVGEQHRSAQEQMAIAMDRTADAVEYLAAQFGYVAEAAGTSVEAINKIPPAVEDAAQSADVMVDEFAKATPQIEAEFEEWVAANQIALDEMVQNGKGLPDEFKRGCWGPIGQDAEDAFQDILEDAKRKFDQIPPIELEYDVPPLKLPKPDDITVKVRYKAGELPDAVGFQTFAHGGPVYAQQGLFVPRGSDTVPAMLTPGEVVLPTDVVATLRRSLASPPSAPITVHVTITALDGADVERVVRSAAFGQALKSTVSSNVGGLRTDLRSAIGVR